MLVVSLVPRYQFHPLLPYPPQHEVELARRSWRAVPRLDIEDAPYIFRVARSMYFVPETCIAATDLD